MERDTEKMREREIRTERETERREERQAGERRKKNGEIDAAVNCSTKQFETAS